MIINPRHYLSAGLTRIPPLHYYESDDEILTTADPNFEAVSYDDGLYHDTFTYVPQVQSLSNNNAGTVFDEYYSSPLSSSAVSSTHSTTSLSSTYPTTPCTSSSMLDTAAHYTTVPTTSALQSLPTLSTSESYASASAAILSSSSIVISTRSPTSSLAEITRAAISRIPSSSIATSASTSSSITATPTHSNMAALTATPPPLPQSTNNNSTSNNNKNGSNGEFISRFFNNLPHSPVSIVVLVVILACILIITIAITTFFLRRIEKRRKRERMTLDMFERPLGGGHDEESRGDDDEDGDRYYGDGQVIDEDGWSNQDNANFLRNSSSSSHLLANTDLERGDIDHNMAVIPRPEPVMQPSHLHIEYNSHGQPWLPTAYTYATSEEYHSQQYPMNAGWPQPHMSHPQIMNPVWQGDYPSGVPPYNDTSQVQPQERQEEYGESRTGIGSGRAIAGNIQKANSTGTDRKTVTSQVSEPFFSHDIFSRSDDRYTAAWLQGRKRHTCPAIPETTDAANAATGGDSESGSKNDDKDEDVKSVKFVDTWLCDVPDTISKKRSTIRKPQPLSTRYHTSQTGIAHARNRSLDSALGHRYQKIQLQTNYVPQRNSSTMKKLSVTLSPVESFSSSSQSSSSLSPNKEKPESRRVLSVRNKTPPPAVRLGCAGPRPLPGAPINGYNHLFVGNVRRTHSIATTITSEYSQKTALSERTMVARELLRDRSRRQGFKS